MSAYEDLVERCVFEARLASYDSVRIILAEVLRTLSTVTPEMVAAWHETPEYSSGPDRDWSLMLRASPLTPPNV